MKKVVLASLSLVGAINAEASGSNLLNLNEDKNNPNLADVYRIVNSNLTKFKKIEELSIDEISISKNLIVSGYVVDYFGPEEKLPQLNSLLNEKLDRIVRDHAIKNGISIEVATKEKNKFLMYMSTIHLTDGDDSIDFPADGDEFWHTFLMHTKDYQDFCNRHFGKFIHHIPGDPMIEKPSFEEAPEVIKILDRNYGVIGNRDAKSMCSTCDADWCRTK